MMAGNRYDLVLTYTEMLILRDSDTMCAFTRDVVYLAGIDGVTLIFSVKNSRDMCWAYVIENGCEGEGDEYYE